MKISRVGERKFVRDFVYLAAFLCDLQSKSLVAKYIEKNCKLSEERSAAARSLGPSRCLSASTGCWLLLAFHLSQALFQSGHEIHHRSELFRLFDFRYLAAFQLGLDQVLEIVLKFIVIFFRFPVGCKGLDQLVRNFDFSFFQFNIRRAEPFYLADFLFVVHGVQHESALVRPKEYRVLSVVHGQFGDSHILTFFQRFGQQRVWASASFLGHHVIRRFEVDRIDLAFHHEFQNLHRLGGLRFDLLDLLRLNHHIFVFAVLVSLHNLAALNYAIVARAIKLLLDAREIIAVQHVKGNARTARTGEKPYRHGNQAEGKIARPNRGRHNFAPYSGWRQSAPD